MYKRRSSVITPSSRRYSRPFKRPRMALSVRRTGGNYNQVGKRRGYSYGQGPEKKFVDTEGPISVASLDYSGFGSVQPGSGNFTTPALLNPLALGTSASQRIGRKVIMKSIQGRISFTCQNDQGTGIQPTLLGGYYRMLIVYDKQTNGALPVATDIIQQGNSSQAQSPLNLSNRERFSVICDKVIHVDPESQQQREYHFYKKLNLPVVFNGGNAGTVADIATGSVVLMLATTLQSEDDTNVQTMSYFRIRFVDN